MDNITFNTVDVLGRDFEQYKKLNNHLFKILNYSNAWFYWYFMQSFQCNIRTYGAFDGKKLIGIWSVEPQQFKYNGKVIRVGRCFATGIHENYRRRGIFINLSKFALQKEKELGEYKYIVGFPTKGRSVIGGHLKAGWYPVQEIEIRELVNENIQDTLNLHSVNPGITEKRLSSNGEFHFSTSFLKDRWNYHPENYYIRFCLKKIPGHIILKPYKDFCHILDVWTETKSGLRTLLKVATGLCKQHRWNKLTIWGAENNPDVKIYKEIGFVSNPENSRIVMIAYNITAKNNMKLKTCRIQNGIEEMY